MKIIEGIDFMCVDKETIIKLALYIDIKDPIDELTYENMLVKGPIEKAG